MYNLIVAEAHTFFVGDGQWLVHNVDPCKGLWQITKEGTDKLAQHGTFGKISRHKTTQQWWSRDTATHGGSVWKVFKETNKGLEWIADADQYGDFVVGKHKGPSGVFIPWKDLALSNL